MPIVLDQDKTGLMIKSDNPNEVGADLIAGGVGTIKKHGYPAILIDLALLQNSLSLMKRKNFQEQIAPGVRHPLKLYQIEQLNYHTLN